MHRCSVGQVCVALVSVEKHGRAACHSTRRVMALARSNDGCMFRTRTEKGDS